MGNPTMQKPLIGIVRLPTEASGAPLSIWGVSMNKA
jgi:hypothetical protein